MTSLLVLTVLVGALGLAVGSFLNVVVHRVPAGLSVVRPASACPRCAHPIRRVDNVPVVSWVLLRGRCRDCRTSIPVRYPLVEASTAVLAVLVTVFLAVAPWSPVAPVDRVGAVPSVDARTVVHDGLVLVAFLSLLAVSVALALIDVDTHRLPDRIVLPATVVLPVLLSVAALVGGDPWAIVRGAAGAAVLGGVYLALALAVPGGMGLGDVKLSVVLGFVLAYLGWGPLAVGSSAAFVIGGSFAIVLVVLRRADRRSGIPFGPWMLLGAWTGIVVGQPLSDAYLRAVGLT